MIPLPDYALACELLAAGEDVDALVSRCGFQSGSAARAFARSPEVREHVNEHRRDRVERIGSLALTRLEALLNEDKIDHRSLVAAIRTGYGVAVPRNKPSRSPVGNASELSHDDLRALIELTRAELQRRSLIVDATAGDQAANDGSLDAGDDSGPAAVLSLSKKS